MIASRRVLVYIGEADPPDYCLENFVDEADLFALLELNCRLIANVQRVQISREKLKKSPGR